MIDPHTSEHLAQLLIEHAGKDPRELARIIVAAGYTPTAVTLPEVINQEQIAARLGITVPSLRTIISRHKDTFPAPIVTTKLWRADEVTAWVTTRAHNAAHRPGSNPATPTD